MVAHLSGAYPKGVLGIPFTIWMVWLDLLSQATLRRQPQHRIGEAQKFRQEA